MSRRQERDRPTPQMKMLADTIRVNPLKNRTIKAAISQEEELTRRCKNYREFKSVYETNIKDAMVHRTSDTSRNYCFHDPLNCVFKSKKRGQVHYSEDIFIPQSLKPIKTVKMQIPKLGKSNAIIKVPKLPPLESKIEKKTETADKKVGSTHDFINKLKNMERNMPQNCDLIQQTNDELNIASNQLDEIQNLIKNKLSQTKKDNGTRTRVQPKWNPKNKVDRCDTQKNKLLNTLNTLNNKLQRMQDKYFSQPHIRYRCVNDFPSKSVEVIFKNDKFDQIARNEFTDNRKTISTISTKVQNKPNTTDLRSLALHEMQMNNNFKIFSETSSQVNRSNSPKLSRKSSAIVENLENQSALKDNKIIYCQHKQGDGPTGLPKAVKARSEYNRRPVSPPAEIKEILKSDYLSKEFSINLTDALTFANRAPASDRGQPFDRLSLFRSAAELRRRDRAPEYKQLNSDIYNNMEIALRNSLYTAIQE